MDAVNDIGGRIALLRKKHGQTQQDLAHYIGVSRSVLAQWESNSRSIHDDMIITIAIFFGVSTDFILCGMENAYTTAASTTGLSYDAIKKVSRHKEDPEYISKINNFILTEG